MRFNALLVAGSLLAVGGLVALGPVRSALGLALDETWQLALIHAELALAPLLFMPVAGGRGKALTNLAAAAACTSAGAATVLLFSFAVMGGVGLDTRALAGVAWLAVSGLLALGARFGPHWVLRVRVLVLCAFGLPALWHYLLLEYAGASGGHLAALSPNWALATHSISLWPLLLAGALAWSGALALPDRGRA